jgi:Protein of unknown function (DUF1479)
MSFVIENLPEAIKAAKSELRAALPQYREIFREIEAEMRRKVDEIVKEREARLEVMPIIGYTNIENNSVPAEQIKKIKSRGSWVIRGTFPREQAANSAVC